MKYISIFAIWALSTIANAAVMPVLNVGADGIPSSWSHARASASDSSVTTLANTISYCESHDTYGCSATAFATASVNYSVYVNRKDGVVLDDIFLGDDTPRVNVSSSYKLQTDFGGSAYAGRSTAGISIRNQAPLGVGAYIPEVEEGIIELEFNPYNTLSYAINITLEAESRIQTNSNMGGSWSASAYLGGFGVESAYSDYFEVSIEQVIPTTITTVPIPAAAWLFGSALLGLGAIKRRKGSDKLAS